MNLFSLFIDLSLIILLIIDIVLTLYTRKGVSEEEINVKITVDSAELDLKMREIKDELNKIKKDANRL